jgi:hypothetical protein
MASEKLQKVTLNLYEDDVEFFERRFGYGWSAEVRRIMRREVLFYRKMDILAEINGFLETMENNCDNSPDNWGTSTMDEN